MRRSLRLVVPLLVTLMALATVAARRAWSRAGVEAEASTPPPLRTVPALPWVEPVDGHCPAGYPVKGNTRSGIYHLPSGRHYARTSPDRCYRNAVAAETDGLRAAKS